MFKIIITPNPILNEIAKPVEKFDKALVNTVKGMEEALLATYDPIGVGLAAPQVNIPLRIFAAKPNDKSAIKFFINPEITEISKELPNNPDNDKRLLEGCLSIPNIWGNVTRHEELTLVWQDVTGKRRTKHFKGFMATIIQHEIDHLNGILFTKHVIEQGEKLFRSYKDKDGEDQFDEIKL